MVARTSPASTLSPTSTVTEVTFPAAGNDAVALVTLASVPVPARVWLIDPVVALVVTNWSAVERDCRACAPRAVAAVSAATVGTPISSIRRRRRCRRSLAGIVLAFVV